MRLARIGLPAFLLLLATTGASAQNPCGYAFTATGATLYREHCAACHGPDGKGDGPEAKKFSKPVDLTGIKKRNNGEFPSEKIAEIIRYGGGIPGHGQGPMPIWAKIFSEECGPAFSRHAVVELKDYVESLQK